MRIALLAVTVTLVIPTFAQDTRHVVEPIVPPVCKALAAQLHAPVTEADESKLDTARIQEALDHCGKGKAVALQVAGEASSFLSGPLQLRDGVTLLVDKGATLYASRDPKVYETSPGSCGIVNDGPGGGCKPLISVKNVSGAAVMGDGTIDGRGGAKLLDGTKTWWDLAEDARPLRRQQVPRILVADHADNFTIYRITLKNSPNFHVVYSHGDGFTVWGLKIDTPKRLARNTDGVDPGGSKNITITHSFIRTGDDDVAIKGGEPISHISIIHNHFYYGHGMSIGSETNGGVSAMLVEDLSLDGPDSGIRIKSMGTRGGLVQGITYRDICIRNSPRPIDITASYAANGPVKGNSPPTFRDITLQNVRVSGGGQILLDGYDQTHRAAVTLDNVQTDSAPYTFSVSHSDVHLGPGPVNFKVPVGEDTTQTGTVTPGKAASCEDKFVPFPQP
jgi:polygalacturonase